MLVPTKEKTNSVQNEKNFSFFLFLFHAWSILKIWPWIGPQRDLLFFCFPNFILFGCMFGVGECAGAEKLLTCSNLLFSGLLLFFWNHNWKGIFHPTRGRPKLLLVESFLFSVWRSSLSINFYGTSFHAGPFLKVKFIYSRGRAENNSEKIL